MSEGKRMYDLALSSSGKATTLSAAGNGEVQIHSWNPSNGILIDEVTLPTLINVEAVQSAFINEDKVHVVESKESGLRIQSYDLKTGKESETKIDLNNLKECVHTDTLFACLSMDERSVHYASLPFEESKLDQLTLTSIADTNDIESISAVDDTSSVVLKYKSKTTSNILLLSLIEGKLTEGKSYER